MGDLQRFVHILEFGFRHCYKSVFAKWRPVEDDGGRWRLVEVYR